jgi:hypothetical protein
LLIWNYKKTDDVVNRNGAVSDQKISKFFVSHMKESMEGHVGINEVY